MRAHVALTFLAGALAAPPCVAPGTCTPPDARFSRVVAGPEPGVQWETSGGFCGAFSLQHAMLGYGAWVSQDFVRKANRAQTGIPHNMHGDTTLGYEVMPVNVAYTAAALKLNFIEWDSSAPKPQAAAYKRWLKAQLAAGYPVVWFPICKGDPHECYPGSCPNGGQCDHVELAYGLYSNHALSDGAVYDDDVIVHTSDQDLAPYYRRINSLDDSLAMNGNCASAVPGFGHNEMFPCFDNSVTYGLSVTGLNVSGALPVSLSTPGAAGEPNIRVGQPAVPLSGVVTVSGLAAGKAYTLYRYNSTAAVPAGPPFAATAWESRYDFTAAGTSFTHVDPAPFMSSGATYYVAAAAEAPRAEAAPRPLAPSGNTTWHVVWVGGQSNSGSNTDVSQHPEWPVNPLIQMFVWQANATGAVGTFQPASLPVFNEHNVGFSQTFANLLLPTLPPDHGVIIVNTGVGGTGFYDKNWVARTGPLATRSVRVVSALVAAFPAAFPGNHYTFHAMLWHQGELDAGDNRDNFHASYCTYLVDDMAALVDYFRASFVGATPSTPFVNGGLLPYWVDTIGATGGVPAAIAALNTSRACTGTADSGVFAPFLPDGVTPNGDPNARSGVPPHSVIHFSAQQNIFLSFEFWRAYLAALKVTSPAASAATAACGGAVQPAVSKCG